MIAPVAKAAEPKRVLVIHTFGRDFAPFNLIGLALRADLTQRLGQPVVFYEASLDAERGTPEDERPIVEYLLGRSRGAPPDLVIANGTPAMRLYLRNRGTLLPDRPLLVTGIDKRMLAGIRLGSEDRVVSADLDLPSVVQTILDLQPDTNTIAIVLGASPLERFWVKEMKRELAPFGDRVRVLLPDGLSLEQMCRRVAELPPRSAVYYQMFSVGGDGVQHEHEQALAAIRQASSAPVFGLFANQLGNGVVGGSLFDLSKVGSVTAELSARMLQGEGGDNVMVTRQPPAFDWRELERWGIPESRLPPGAEVRFRPPSVWHEHRLLILTGSATVLFQSFLIAALLFQRAQRRRAEEEAVGLSGRLITAHEDERRHLARELHDDLTQRLARLAIDAARMPGMHKDLVRLSEDVHALSYRLHPALLDDLGLVEALRAECDRVGRDGALRVEVDASGVPDELPDETSLCLFRVAQEALSNVARHAHASAVTVLLSSRRRGLQLAVSDNGSGFDPARTSDHASLGFAGMRERVRLLRGELDIESTPGRGTTVVAWVPA